MMFGNSLSHQTDVFAARLMFSGQGRLRNTVCLYGKKVISVWPQAEGTNASGPILPVNQGNFSLASIKCQSETDLKDTFFFVLMISAAALFPRWGKFFETENDGGRINEFLGRNCGAMWAQSVGFGQSRHGNPWTSMAPSLAAEVSVRAHVPTDPSLGAGRMEHQVGSSSSMSGLV